jgi:hypothetical protein
MYKEKEAKKKLQKGGKNFITLFVSKALFA